MFSLSALQRFRRGQMPYPEMSGQMLGQGMLGQSGQPPAPPGLTAGLVPAQYAPPQATSMTAPAQLAAPAPVQPPPTGAQDDEIVVTPPMRPPPSYGGPLAMDASTARYQQPKLTWRDKLSVLGNAFSEQGGTVAKSEADLRARQRRPWEEEQALKSRDAMLGGVRTAIERERMSWEARAAQARSRGQELPTFQESPVMQVARMVPTPEAFLEWYAKYSEAQAGRDVQGRGLDIQEKGVDGELRQGDRRLDLQALAGDRDYELGKGGLAVNRMQAETQRRAQQDASPGKDPLERALIGGDVDRLASFDDDAQRWGGMRQDLADYAAANQAEPGTGALSLAKWSPFVNKETERMKEISERLAMGMRQAGTGAMSDKDKDGLLAQVPGVGKSQAANLDTIKRFQAAERRAAERAHYGREYLRRDRSLETFNRLWGAYINEATISAGDTRSFGEWMSAKQAEMGARK